VASVACATFNNYSTNITARGETGCNKWGRWLGEGRRSSVERALVVPSPRQAEHR
jgi:hypothetical protein